MLTAIVPARSGSRRLPGKNLKEFLGLPLLVRKIRQLQAAGNVDAVLVSSDSEEYLDIAKAEGAMIHMRSMEYSDDVSVPFSEVIRHVAEFSPGDDLAWTPCTSPLFDELLIREAVKVYRDGLGDGFDSLVSLERFKRFVWSEFGAMNYSANRNHQISQDLPEMAFMCDACMIAPRAKMIEWRYWHGPNPIRFYVGKRAAVDIDDELDFKQAEAWAQ